MKIRVGFGITGAQPISPRLFGALCDTLETTGFDSLWLSERMAAPSFDPVTALSFAAGRTARIKLGTSVSVLPGRNPAELAKQWATLDLLSGHRALPAFGLGIVHPNEQQAFGVKREERVGRFEEMLPLLRRIWNEESVDHHGEYFHYDALRIEPKPSAPLDVWMGGKAPSELRRVGRLSDGWLASFATPERCLESRGVIDAAATDCGRIIDPEHFGAMVFYRHGALPDALAAIITGRDPEVDPNHLVPDGFDAVRKRCEEFVAVGFSKLVLVPFGLVEDWTTELGDAAQTVLSIQN